jgi:dihydrofolate reductase
MRAQPSSRDDLAVMAKLIYAAITSLDGFIEDSEGRFDWAMPDAEVHAFLNELEAPIRTHLYGRRMYETMAVWETVVAEPSVHVAEVEYAELWRALDKVVYSRTIDAVWTPRTQLERQFDAEAVRQMKETAAGDVSVSGPDLAQHAFRAGLVDEVHLFVFPVIVGGGKSGLPREVKLDLELLDQRRFANGVVHMHHRAR